MLMPILELTQGDIPLRVEKTLILVHQQDITIQLVFVMPILEGHLVIVIQLDLIIATLVMRLVC